MYPRAEKEEGVSFKRKRNPSLTVAPVKTLGALISIKQFKPVSCFIAGGNLYDKILRQKDKLFEEEVIHISVEGS